MHRQCSYFQLGTRPLRRDQSWRMVSYIKGDKFDPWIIILFLWKHLMICPGNKVMIGATPYSSKLLFLMTKYVVPTSPMLWQCSINNETEALWAAAVAHKALHQGLVTSDGYQIQFICTAFNLDGLISLRLLYMSLCGLQTYHIWYVYMNGMSYEILLTTDDLSVLMLVLW